SADPVFLYKRSQIYTEMEKYEDAIADLEECIKLARNPEYYKDEANIYTLMGNRKKALEVVENALKTSPENLSLKALKSKIENVK
ncbi:MAG: hypothetical protein QXS49_05095, partial [Ferroplasma sp.]